MIEKDTSMTVKEATEFLGLHENTIRNYIENGKLRAEKVGKSYRINRSDVFEIYTAKRKVDRSSEAIISIQRVMQDIDRILISKYNILFSTMKNLIKKREEYDAKLSEEITKIDKREHNITTVEERKKYANLDLNQKMKLIEKYDKDILDLLLESRKDIESFYNTFDMLENLGQFYKYIDHNKSTLDKEIERHRKILNKQEINDKPIKISIYDLFT